MGFHARNMTPSKKLKELVLRLMTLADYCDWFSDNCDCVSTRGHDNDGSIGPEMVDNGVGLAFACRDYDKDAKIFLAFGTDACYYQFGKDEDDAMARLNKSLREHSEINKLPWPPPPDAGRSRRR
jgi:hypothetical protein